MKTRNDCLNIHFMALSSLLNNGIDDLTPLRLVSNRIGTHIVNVCIIGDQRIMIHLFAAIC